MTDRSTVFFARPALPAPDPTQPLGSRANPVILDPMNPDFMAAAHALYANLRQECPVARARLRPFEGETELTEADRAAEARSPFSAEVWLTTQYDTGVEALLDDDGFAVDPLKALTPEQREALPPPPEEFLPLSRSLLTLDPPDHTRLRKLVQPWFTGRAIDALRPRIAELANDLLDRADAAAAARGESAPHRRMELIESFAYPLPVTVISEMLGVPRDDRERIRQWTELLFTRRGPTLTEEQRVNLHAISEYFKDLATRKRAEPAEDLISFLVQAEDDGDRLDDQELLSMIFIIYVAGHITTVNLIGNGIVALLTHPEELTRIQRDPSLARNLVEETLRYWGPAEQTFPRIALDDITVGDVVIPRGDRVMVSLAAADRDPERFADPDRFDVGRPDANRHIAFGKGIHVCLGAPLARAEGEIAFATLLARYPDLRLAVPAAELTWRENFLRGFREIPLNV
ncbi:MAG: cytochrome P450 [Thermomicrobiales bacterium]